MSHNSEAAKEYTHITNTPTASLTIELEHPKNGSSHDSTIGRRNLPTKDMNNVIDTAIPDHWSTATSYSIDTSSYTHWKVKPHTTPTHSLQLSDVVACKSMSVRCPVPYSSWDAQVCDLCVMTMNPVISIATA